MTVRAANALPAVQLLEFQGSAIAPLDLTAEYLRARIDRVLPMYMLAMTPHAVASAMLIGAIAAEQGGRVSELCIALVVATLWRWVWISRLQYGVQHDLQGQRGPFWPRIGSIILVRLFSNAALTWGSLLVVPGFLGLFIGSFSAPLLLENDEPTTTRVRKAISWIQFSSRRMIRVLLAMTAVGLLLLTAIFVAQEFLSQWVLPSIVGIDSTDLNLTLNGWTWRLGVLYFTFLLLDCFWTVLSVVLYDDSRARRTATDLRTRLAVIAGAKE